MPPSVGVIHTQADCGAADIDTVLQALRRGAPIVLCHRDGADIVLAAGLATVEATAFMIRHTSGFLRVALTDERCERLMLPNMSATFGHGPCDRVSVDASSGTSTGISAHDRALTARTLADPKASAADFTRPGHIITTSVGSKFDADDLSATRTAVRVVDAAGLSPVAMVAALESPSDPTRSADRYDAVEFAREHEVLLTDVDSVLRALAS